VSLPPFDSNAFVDGIDPVLYHRLLDDPNLPLIHRAIAGEYPSGSVFKPVVAYAALAEGIISEQTTVMSRGGLSVGPWFFPDWKAGGHGLTDVKKAIADSVNTFFYMVGGGYESMAGLGVDRITSTARLFGFGQKTGISLTGEADGFLPSSAWKEEAKGERWYVGDTYHLAIGQGDLLVTPLQMAVATAMIANDGRRLTPNLIEGVDGYASSYAPPKQPEVDPTIHLDALRVVREGMRRTVTHGTARSLQDLPFAVAGKTGTAQTPKEGKTHAWFTGFAPSEDPQIAVVVLLEDAGEGSEFATPVARVIFEWWAKHEE
jgi:penicillin-binding protein 2